MISLTTLYDEYIDQSKLSEQKKNPVEYIVPPPPSRGVGTITTNFNFRNIVRGVHQSSLVVKKLLLLFNFALQFKLQHIQLKNVTLNIMLDHKITLHYNLINN